MMALIAQMVVNGFLLSAIYMLMASGLALIYGIMHQVNMAHGVIYMLGAMFAYFLVKGAGLHYFTSIILLVLLFPLVGVLIERALFRPIRHDWMAGYMSSLGVWILIEGLGWQYFGTVEKALTFPIQGVVRLPGGATLPLAKLAVAVIALTVIAALYWFVSKTRLGRELRAIEQQPVAAKLVGVDSDRTIALGFAIGVTLAALAGGLGGAIYSISPACGTTPLLKAFVIVIVGGLGSIAGAIVASLMVGFVDSFAGTLLGPQAGYFLEFGVMAAVLILKPQGILGHE